MESERTHGMALIYDLTHPNGVWKIYKHSDCTSMFVEENTVWCRDQLPNEDCGDYTWPADMRSEYERLTGKPEFTLSEQKTFTPEPVELLDDSDGSGFNQPCRFGYLVEGHSVYCHNERWLYAPRKCRRTWYTNGERRDEDCPGYLPHRKKVQ